MSNINNYHNLKRFKDAAPTSFIIEEAVVDKMQLVEIRNFYADYFKELIRIRMDIQQNIKSVEGSRSFYGNKKHHPDAYKKYNNELKWLGQCSKYYKHLAIMIGQLRDGLTFLMHFFPKKEMKMNVRISWCNNRVDIEPVKSYTDEAVWKMILVD